MRDKPEYIDCPECGGSGELMEAHMYPSGHTEVWVDCKLCEGLGNFELLDYLVMKLAGMV